MKKFDLSLLEIDPSDGVAVYYHAEDCPSYCDFACNGHDGYVIAAAYNAGVSAQHGVQRTGQVGCSCNKFENDWFGVCGKCGAKMPRR